MNGFLLDTNVVSELRKKERCAPKVSAWAATVPRNQDFLSVLVVGELMRGANLKRRADPQMADALAKWIARLTHLYSERILPVTLEVAQEWGRLFAACFLLLAHNNNNNTHTHTLTHSNDAGSSVVGVAAPH